MNKFAKSSTQYATSFTSIALSLSLLDRSTTLIANTESSSDFIQPGDRSETVTKISLLRPVANFERIDTTSGIKPAVSGACHEHAHVFLNVSPDGLPQQTFITIESNFGARSFLLNAQMSAIEVASQLNASLVQIWVQAAVASENPNRVELKSFEGGDLWFVHATQSSGPNIVPIVVNEVMGGQPVFDCLDFGCAENMPCVEFARAFLKTGATLTNEGGGAIAFELVGDAGYAALAFLSGTSASNIVDSINTFVYETSIVAKVVPSPFGGGGIELRSAFPASNSFLSVHQLNGDTPVVQTSSDSSEASFELLDFGSNHFPGDVTGDDVINIEDLTALLNNWGKCWPPDVFQPPCPGDLNSDGNVNVDDLLNVINNWGPGECK